MAEEKKTRFNGKRLSRNIVPIIIGAVVILLGIAFVSTYGVDKMSPAEKEKIEKMRKDKEDMISNSKAISEQDSKAELDERERKASEGIQSIKDKLKNQAEQENEVIAGGGDGSLLDSPISAGGMPVPKDVQDYEKRKAQYTRSSFSGSSSGAAGSMAVYEDGFDGIVTKAFKGATDITRDAAEGIEQSDMNKQRTGNGQSANSQPFSTGNPNDEFSKAKEKEAELAKSAVIKAEAPVSKYALLEGTTINTVLVTAIDSQLPGRILARTTQDVYDSIRGEYLLVPKGSTVIGTYNASVNNGQSRVFIVFNRLIFPSGVSVQLGSMTGSDAQGISGIAGNVFSTFWKQIGSSFLLAGIGAIATPDNNSNTTNFNIGGTAGGYGAGASSNPAGQILVETSRANLQRFAQYQPRITVVAGEKLTIVVAKDIDLPPSKIQKDYE